MATKLNKLFKPCTCNEVLSPHLHSGQWEEYWNALSKDEKQSIKNKAKWEQRSLSSIAAEYGAKL